MVEYEDAIYADSPSCSLEESLQRSIRLQKARQIINEITDALEGLGENNLIPTKELIQSLTNSVLDLTENEPYGMFGCRIDFFLARAVAPSKTENENEALGSFTFEEHVVTTHVLRVVLSEAPRRRWFSLQHYAAKMRPQSFQSPVFLTDKCLVQKQRLYR